MKKILFAIALFLMVFVSSPLDLFAANGVISGDGSTLTPYLIEDVNDFKTFRDSVNSGTSYDGLIIKFTANLDLSTISNWESIGKDNTNSFKGTFEGNNKKITGLTMTGSNGIASLFGYNRGTVQNLTLINSSMVDTNNIDDAGVVAAINYGSILNIVSKNEVISFTTSYSNSWHGLGGIVGINFGTVDYCGNVGGSITSTTNNNGRRIGGVVGESKGGVIRNCYNTADVNAKSSAVGGIVENNNVNGGSGTKTEVLNCYNIGNISGNNKIGGVTGETTGSAYLKKSFNAGKTTASSNVGSIAGNTTNGTLDHNFGVKGVSENSTSNAVGYGLSTGTSIITKSTENLTTLLNELNSWVDTNNAGVKIFLKCYIFNYLVDN